MKQLFVRFLNLAVIVAVLLGYNAVLDRREKEDQIAQLSAELETVKLQKESLQTAAADSVLEENDTASAVSSDDADGMYVDGTYEGEADGFGGTIAVQATIEGGRLTDLSITSADGEDSAYLSNAEAIIPKIIEAQSADVDTISGATFSSTGIRDAAEEALEKAEK